MQRYYNFGAGPAMLPTSVLKEAREELLDWHRTGMSIMEISHRSDYFRQIAFEAEQDLRDLLDIPNHYHVLFLQGGARTQFAMVPMNLSSFRKRAAYLNTGVWSSQAIVEAQRFCKVKVIADAKTNNFSAIPTINSWQLPDSISYLHYIDNETVNGLEFPSIPNISLPSDCPIVVDMSSNLLSRPFDISKFGLMYASAQKNIGPAGLTVVIIREDLLKREPLLSTPNMLRYKSHVERYSMLNTPPTFAWYLSGLVFKWLKNLGGLSAIAKINKRKSDKLYNFIDNSNFYVNRVEPEFRSRMNVVFNLKNEKLTAAFLEASSKAHLMQLQGHRIVGGMRASLYNAMPESGIDALIKFMKNFESKH